MTACIAIAGAGHAAGQLIASLRQGGFDGRIVLAGEEPWLPYQRPPLSKKFLSGELALDRLLLRHQAWYADHRVDLHLETRVTGIDRAARRIFLDGGKTVDYSSLVLATGSRVRRLALPGAELDGIHYLRTIDDVHAIQHDFKPGARLAVVGGGYIGLEVAAVAVTHGLEVTVLEAAPRVMSRVVSEPVSSFYEDEHRKAGVTLRLDCGVRGFSGTGRIESVMLADGSSLPADLAVVGVGVAPVCELAEDAGLACDDGIVVDENCITSDPDILAIGDCTRHPNPLLGRRLRLESVHNAQEQGKTAAAWLCGKPRPYADIPWFWSDQYDLKLQIVGLSGPEYEAVVRGDPATRSFAVFYLDGDRLVAVDAINSAREFMLSKKLIAAGARLDTARLADPGSDFKALAAAALEAAAG
ncbi:MAG: FAD-dependent oxidoreductase [Chromatiales bacterium]|nr:FAD-dependent oxidoreductase [Chromatiales bacterium]